MRKTSLAIAAVLATIVSVEPAMAESCYDLWYERNSIYDANGYCFTTTLGRQTFDNSDCYTKRARLSADEQWRVDQIQEEEARRGCNVN